MLVKLPTWVFCGLVVPLLPFQAGLPSKVSTWRLETFWPARKSLPACRAAARSARLKDVRVTVAAWAPLPSPAASAAASIGPKSRAGTKVRMEKPL